MILTAGELAAVRGVAELTFADTCTIQRPDSGLSDSGFPVDTVTTVATGVPCRLVRAVGSRETQSSGEVQSAQPLIVLLPHDTAIRPTDQIVVNGRTLQVSGQTVDVTNEIAKEIEVTEMGAEAS